MTTTLKLFPLSVLCMAVALLSACGGGSGGSGNSVTTYQVNATAGTGGTISPATVTVNAGSTTTLTVTPKSGYVLSGVTGCAGSLSGSSYTTGAVNATCTVTASFSAAFTWVGGSNTSDASAVYGTQGVAAASNVPGARDGGITWTDSTGNLWMFGGFAGYSTALNPAVGNFLNDLWKYSPSSGQWTWVGGATTACSQGVYGTQGVAAAANVPGARVGVSWTDANGNLWLFGGGGCDSTGSFVLFEDLWEYSSSSGEWTWVGGSTTTNTSPVYGTKGVAAASNTPGSRVGGARWTDANANVVMFGGFGIDSSNSSGAYLSDLWQYSPSSGKWTWIGGPNTFNAKGVYGTQGTADAANVPGARSGAVTWTDAQGNFWLFGGGGYDSNGIQHGALNDLWKYSPSTSEWTWEGGSNTINSTGVYGTMNVGSAANVPPARASAASWKDASDNVWVLGGEGLDTTSSPQLYHRFNDLWKYSLASGQWTWAAGSNTFDATGVYGTQGVAAATNVPGARAAAAIWTDTSGDAWLFGGYQYDDPSNTRFEMNDLWKYPTQ
jgi:hypothetical protein